MQRFGVSQRHACRVLGAHRSSVRQPLKRVSDEEKLTQDILYLALRYRRYGYRRITALLKVDGWRINHKRVERIWREQGLHVPRKQLKRKRLYDHAGSCIRLRPLYPNHVWAYDFVTTRLAHGKKIRLLTLIDEFTRECLAVRVAYRLKSCDVLETLSELFITHGLPQHIRSDNGPEFTASILQKWLKDLGVTTTYITPASPWENGYNERFNGSLQDECLKPNYFYSLKEARGVIAEWVKEYNHIRPHSSLGYTPPVLAPRPLSTALQNSAFASA